MPPPTISRSTFCARLLSTVSFVDTFAPATMATSGRPGWRNARPSASTSAASSGPAQAIGAKRAMACVVASARCAAPNASFTYTSHSDASRRASSSLSFFSPLLTRQFSSSTTCPGRTSTPPSQSRTSGTVIAEQFRQARRPPAPANRRASVPLRSAAPDARSPSRRLPQRSAIRMAGSEARIRVSSLIAPARPSNGTFRSERMNTRLPCSAPFRHSSSSPRIIVLCAALPPPAIRSRPRARAVRHPRSPERGYFEGARLSRAL